MSESPRTPSPRRDGSDAPGAPAKKRHRPATPATPAGMNTTPQMPSAPVRRQRFNTTALHPLEDNASVNRNLLAAFDEVEKQLQEAEEFYATQDGEEQQVPEIVIPEECLDDVSFSWFFGVDDASESEDGSAEEDV